MRKAALLRHLLWPLGAALVAAAAGLAGPAWAACQTGQITCGAYCMWNRQTCCASVGHDDKYCPAGRTCATDGTTCLGSALACGTGQVAAISSCGSDSCACAQSCTSSAGCPSGCCATPSNATSIGMFCAPSCVCSGSGVLVAYCGETLPQYDGGTIAGDGGGGSQSSGPSADPFGKGCSLGGSGDAGAGAGVFLALALLGWRRRARS
jgi:hypothetical protein